MSQWMDMKERVGGKWQIPALLISGALLASAFFRALPTPDHLALDQAIVRLKEFGDLGLHDKVIEFGDLLLIREREAHTDCSTIHLYLARARYVVAERDRLRSAATGHEIIEHYKQADRVSKSFTADDFESMGRTFEWQDQVAAAVDHYETALELGASFPQDLRRHILGLRLDRLGTPNEEALVLLTNFLEAVGDDRLDLKIWGIERQVDVSHELGRIDEVPTLLARYRDRFQNSGYRDHFNYLEALLLARTGHYDEAESHLRAIRNRVRPGDEVHAMTGWLLGRVVMGEDEPQRPAEAISFFNDVIKLHPRSPYSVASRVGLAEALTMLERREEALNAYRVVVQELDAFSQRRLVDRRVVRASLGVSALAEQAAGRLREAVSYQKLAVDLVAPGDVEERVLYGGHLAHLMFRLGEKLEGIPSEETIHGSSPLEASSAEARALFLGAAEIYVGLAQISALAEAETARYAWRAAELCAVSGERARAAKMFLSYAVERPENPLVPRGLLRVGQLRYLSGELSEAIETYKECYRRFPRTLDGARALVPLARCYLAMGSEYDELAEKTLRIVLEDSEVFTPMAPEFANASFLLGEALNRRGEFERAIATLEEALTRYPDDPRVWRGRFLLADSFRQSGLALKSEVREARFADEIEQMRAESLDRFRTAQGLYHELIEEYERRGLDALNRLERVYLRQSHLYEADCYFEARDYRHALTLYEEAVGVYKDTTSALAAYVQIINSQVFLGQPDEARAALARALVLVDTIPEASFKNSVSRESREDWKRYLKWLGESEVF